MPALSVTSAAAVQVPADARGVQNVGPGRVAIDSDNTVTFATGLILEVGGVYSPSENDFNPGVWARAESATCSLRYIL